MLADTFPEIIFPYMIVILFSLSTTFTLAPNLKEVVFNIDGMPYFPLLGQKEIEANDKIKLFCYERLNEAISSGYELENIRVDGRVVACYHRKREIIKRHNVIYNI